MDIKTGLTALAIVAAFAAGYHVSSMSWQAEVAEAKASVADQSYAALESVWRETLSIQALADMAGERVLKDAEDVEREYREVVDALNQPEPDDGLRQSGGRSSDGSEVPDRAGTTGTACSPCRCDPCEPNVGAREALEIAKDCDLLATRYNALLELYQSVKRGVNHVGKD